MATGHKYNRSIIGVSDNDVEDLNLDELSPTRPDFNRPLVNNANASNVNDDDDQRSFEHIEVPFYRNTMHSIDPSLELINTFDQQSQEQIDTDAAIALKLQEEEYLKNRTNSFHQNRKHSIRQQNSNNMISFDGNLVVTDAELAAHLQAEENNSQHQHNSARAPHSTVNAPPSHHRPARGAHHSRFTDDVTPLITFPNNYNNIPQGFPGHRGGHLQHQNSSYGPDDYESLLQLDADDNQRALTTDQIDRLPTEKFHNLPNSNSEEKKCSICMDEFKENEILRRLACFHRYHKICIDNWLKRSNLCPVCRTESIK